MTGSRLALITAALGVLALAANGAASLAWTLALRISSRNSATQASFPWTVWTELAVLATLVLGIVVLARQMPPREAHADRVPVLWIGGPLLVLAAVAGWRFGAFNAVLLLVVSVGALWVGRGLAGLRDRGVWWLLGTALVLRLAVSLGLGVYALAINGGVLVLDDEQSYDFAARQLAQLLAAGHGDLDTEWRHLMGHHLDLLGLLYWLREPSFTSIRLIDAALGTLAVALALGIGRALWGRSAGYVAGWLTALWPLVILWSATGLRESLALVAALLLPWLAFGRPWRDQPPATRPLRVVVGALAAVVLVVARPEALLALGVAVLIVGPGAALARRAATWSLGARLALGGSAVLLVGGVAFVGTSGVVAAIGQPLSPRALEYRAAVAELSPMVEHIKDRLPPKPESEMLNVGTLLRARPPGHQRLETVIVSGFTESPLGYQVVDASGTSFTIDPADVQRPTDENVDWLDVLGRFGDGTRVLLVPPMPWDGGPSRRLLLAPDAIAWDALLVLGLISARHDWRRLSAGRALVYVYPWLVMLGLALTSTNLGTVARHRSTLVPWMVIASAPLLLRLWRGLRAMVRATWRWNGLPRPRAETA